MAEKKSMHTDRGSGRKPGRPPKIPKESAGKQAAMQISKKRFRAPGRGTLAVIYLTAFFVLLTIALHQKGTLLTVIRNAVLGLFGPVTFYLSIPATLYLFVVNAFFDDSSVRSRSGSIFGCLFLIGCISQIAMGTELDPEMSTAKALYETGIESASGGVLCGLFGRMLQNALSAPLSVILLSIGAALCLITAFGLSVPELIRAFREINREEDAPPVQRPDPNVIVAGAVSARVKSMQQKLEQHRAYRAANPRTPVRERVQKLLHREDAPDDMNPQDPDVSVGKRIVDRVMSFRNSETVCVEPTEQRKPEPEKTEPKRPEREQTAPSGSAWEKPEEPPVWQAPPAEPVPDPVQQPAAAPQPAGTSAAPAGANKKVTSQEAAESAEQVTREIEDNLKKDEEKPAYEFPSIELLHRAAAGKSDGTDEMRANTARLNETLASFKIDARVTNVTRGPSVTRYEVELQQGVRLSKLTSVADDIALNLGLGEQGIRIAPVPNKISVVGIEVPNQAVTMVTLRDVVDSTAFRRARSCATFAVGKDISGECIVGNITKLPHMLIAGTTGSGKSVCMNTIILSILFKASPDDVRLIMIDPKMVELGIYNGIPHLLIPVVTDPKKAAGSLQWAVTEMMRRYKIMADASVRDIDSYNEAVDGGSLQGEHMAQVVVVIDELADLMLVAAKEVEESICRIAQMGRAAGVHLLIATQRPSADVITGLMKANIPSRIAFQVASSMESRIILDTNGAEKLLGKGDMLYAPIGCGKPVRVQGCFVSDDEVEDVTDYIKKNYTDSYDEKVLEEIEKNAAKTGTPKSSGMEVDPSADEMAFDDMLIPAVDAVLAAQQASVSMLQRKLKLGFSRAARIVDTMEELGIVGEHAGSKPRQILITPDQWATMKISLTGGEIPAVPKSAQMTMDDALEAAEQAESEESEETE